MRVLIADFDFFSVIGGGQVFYRRVVERNPDVEFHYPSRGPDIALKKKGFLPANANPFELLPANLVEICCDVFGNRHWVRDKYILMVTEIAFSVQGKHFDIVDFPSFFPVAFVCRPVFAACGVTIGKVALAFLGWASTSLRSGYASEVDPVLIRELEVMEQASSDHADIRYTISDVDLHQDWTTDLPIHFIDMHDTIEDLKPDAVSRAEQGKPQLWFVGRLDGAKGPDIFIDIVSRIPADLHGGCFLTGPDNDWAPGRKWSEHVISLARDKGVEATYLGRLSDAELRSRVYRGNNVVIVSSRTDTFNYVALEAVLSGCPVILSECTGAHRFFATRHPALAPVSMVPENPEAAACDLEALLTDYHARKARQFDALTRFPIPRPRIGFMSDVYGQQSRTSALYREESEREALDLINRKILLSAAANPGRAARGTAGQDHPRVSIVLPTIDRPQGLLLTLTQLQHQTLADFEVLVVDGGCDDPEAVREIVARFDDRFRFVRCVERDRSSAIDRGLRQGRGALFAILSDDEGCDPEWLEKSVRHLEAHPQGIGTYPDWDEVTLGGRLVGTHRHGPFDRRAMVCEHRLMRGVGALIRRDVIERTAGYDRTFRWLADLAFWIRATAHGDMIPVPERLAFKRRPAVADAHPAPPLAVAGEHVRLMEHAFANPAYGLAPQDRDLALATAHLAAAEILAGVSAWMSRAHVLAALRYQPQGLDMARTAPAAWLLVQERETRPLDRIPVNPALADMPWCHVADQDACQHAVKSA